MGRGAGPRAGLVRLALAGEVQGAEVGQAERGQLQVGAQFLGMLATGHVALAVLCPARRLGLDLLRHPQDDRLGQLAVGSQRVTGVAQQAELHGEAEAVGVAASLADQRQVGVVEGVVADQVILLSGSASRVSRSVAERIKRRGMCQSSVRRYW